MLRGKMSINFVQIEISYHEKHRELESDELPTILDIIQHYYFLKHEELEQTEWKLTNTLAENVTKVWKNRNPNIPLITRSNLNKKLQSILQRIKVDQMKPNLIPTLISIPVEWSDKLFDLGACSCALPDQIPCSDGFVNCNLENCPVKDNHTICVCGQFRQIKAEEDRLFLKQQRIKHLVNKPSPEQNSSEKPKKKNEKKNRYVMSKAEEKRMILDLIKNRNITKIYSKNKHGRRHEEKQSPVVGMVQGLTELTKGTSVPQSQNQTEVSFASSLPKDGEQMVSIDEIRSKKADKMSTRKQKISEKEDRVIDINIHDNSPDPVNTDSVTEESLNKDLIDLEDFPEIEYQTSFFPLHPTEDSNKIKYVKSKKPPKEIKAFKNLLVLKDDDQFTYEKLQKQLGVQFILIGKDRKEGVRIYARREQISADVPIEFTEKMDENVSEMDQEDSVDQEELIDQEDSIINEGLANLIKAELTGIDPELIKDDEMVYIRNNDSVTYNSRSENGDRLILIGQDMEQNGSIYVVQKKAFDLPKEYIEDMDDIKNVLKQEGFSSFLKIESEFKELKQEMKNEGSNVKDENIEEWRELKEEKMEIPVEENAPCSPSDDSSQDLEILYQSRTEDPGSSSTLHPWRSQSIVVQPKPGAKVIMGKDAIYVLHATPNPNYKLIPRLLKKKDKKNEEKKEEKDKKTEKKKEEKNKKNEEKNELKKKAIKKIRLKKNTKRMRMIQCDECNASFPSNIEEAKLIEHIKRFHQEKA